MLLLLPGAVRLSGNGVALALRELDVLARSTIPPPAGFTGASSKGINCFLASTTLSNCASYAGAPWPMTQKANKPSRKRTPANGSVAQLRG